MMDLLEIIAVLTAILYVFFAAKEKKVCFVFGLISSAIYIYICFVTKFYYDTIISLYYVLMSVYGYLIWGKPRDKNGLEISTLNSKEKIGLLAFGIFLTGIFGYVGQHFLDANLPYVDAFTTVFAIIATWMVVKKVIENWLIWIVVDAVGIGMYYYKELHLTAALYLLYTVVAVIGYVSWKKKHQEAVLTSPL